MAVGYEDGLLMVDALAKDSKLGVDKRKSGGEEEEEKVKVKDLNQVHQDDASNQ